MAAILWFRSCQNQVPVQFSEHARVNRFKEIAKLNRPFTPMELADNGAGLGIERSEKVDHAAATRSADRQNRWTSLLSGSYLRLCEALFKVLNPALLVRFQLSCSLELSSDRQSARV